MKQVNLLPGGIEEVNASRTDGSNPFSLLVNRKTITIKNLDQLGLEEWEKKLTKFQDKTAIVFSSLKLAIHMGRCFIQEDLVPRVGIGEAAKFPLIKTGPFRNADDVMSEVIGVKDPDFEQETWFFISSDRFPEIYEYLVIEYHEQNPEVVIQDDKQW